MENFNLKSIKDITFSEYMEKMFTCIIDEKLVNEMFDERFNGQDFPKIKPDFDQNGLRFDIDFLNSVGTLISILPIQALAQFVDYVTYNNYKSDPTNFHNDLFQIFNNASEINQLNATALGNLAFIYLNTENPKVKQTIKKIILIIARNSADKMGFLQNFKPELSISKTEFKC